MRASQPRAVPQALVVLIITSVSSTVFHSSYVPHIAVRRVLAEGRALYDTQGGTVSCGAGAGKALISCVRLVRGK